MLSILSLFLVILSEQLIQKNDECSGRIIPTDLIFVSQSGTNKPDCGRANSSCRNVSYAGSLTGSGKVFVLPGLYEETAGVNVTGTLMVTGVSALNCELTKPSGIFPMFRVNTNNANLILSKLTLLLTGGVWNTGTIYTEGNRVVTITFFLCRITMNRGLSSIYQESIFIGNTLASMSFEYCTVYNITTTGGRPFISANDIYSLSIASSSFANVKGSGTGSCFTLAKTSIFFLSRSRFAFCRTSGNAGISFVGVGDSGSVIDSCEFWNCSSSAFGGVMLINHVGSSTEHLVTIWNSTHVNCTVSQAGGAYKFQNVHVLLNTSSFLQCSGNWEGGTLIFDTQVTADINKCVFMNNRGGEGGALCVWQSTVSVSDSIFLGNVGLTGSDIMIWGNGSLTITNSFTDAVAPIYDGGRGNNVLNGALDHYRVASCEASFSSMMPLNGSCPEPCVAVTEQSGVCSKPDQCHSEYIPTHGKCVPACSYWVLPADHWDCSSQCSPDFSLGYPVCAQVPFAPTPPGQANTSFCGEGCFFDPENNNSCQSSCRNAAHYALDPSVGLCAPKNCTDRTDDGTVGDPCGKTLTPQCWLDPNSTNTCQAACADRFAFETDQETGKCVPKACSVRGNSSVSGDPCGKNLSPSCWLDPSSNNTCQAKCAGAHYSTNQTTGTCTPMSCIDRTYNSAENDPCGKSLDPPCFFDPGTRNGTCQAVCANSAHQGADKETGLCKSKSCVNRTDNGTSDDPCGKELFPDCWLDPFQDNTCQMRCSNEAHYLLDNSSGRCVPKPCSARSSNESYLKTDDPCGKSLLPTCWLDNGKCEADCGSPTEFQGDPKTGVCVAVKVSVPPESSSKSNKAVIPVVVVCTVVVVTAAAVVVFCLLWRRSRRSRSGYMRKNYVNQMFSTTEIDDDMANGVSVPSSQ